MIEEELREVFETMTREQLVEAAVALSMDADRLRNELDAAQGVIR